MKSLKTLFAGAMLAAFAFGTSAQAADKGMIGISMPTKSSTRWISDGESMVKEFTALGYGTDLQYAEDDIPNQLAQIENMVTKGAKVLIIAAIDGTQLTDVLQAAADAKVPVIAYDRLIRDSKNVDYYATFDNFKVGVLQATSLLVGMGVYASDLRPALRQSLLSRRCERRAWRIDISGRARTRLPRFSLLFFCHCVRRTDG